MTANVEGSGRTLTIIGLILLGVLLVLLAALALWASTGLQQTHLTHWKALATWATIGLVPPIALAATLIWLGARNRSRPISHTE